MAKTNATGWRSPRVMVEGSAMARRSSRWLALVRTGGSAGAGSVAAVFSRLRAGIEQLRQTRPASATMARFMGYRTLDTTLAQSVVSRARDGSNTLGV